MAFSMRDDRFHDYCGVMGVYGHAEAAKLAYLGLYALQHRGQESAGIVASDGADLHAHRGMGLVADVFSEGVSSPAIECGDAEDACAL